MSHPRPGPPRSGEMPRAVLWDMDGTLVDTEPAWIAAEHDLVASHGGTWSDEHALELVGSDLLDAGRYIREHGGIDLEPREIVEQLLDRVVERVRADIPWRPGALELLADLRSAGVPCALVTMSWRRFVEPVLAAMPSGSFDAVVTGDEVSRGKPDPEPYARAADLLGVRPEACVAIEDSVTGTRSAVAAGCTVLVVPHHVAVPTELGGLRRDSLVGLDAAGLGRLGGAQSAETAAVGSGSGRGGGVPPQAGHRAVKEQ